MKRTVWLMAALMVLALPLVGAAQTGTTGRVTGVVADQSGAVLPGVTVTIKGEGPGTARSTVTDSGGRYVIADVAPGPYELTFELAGFTKQTSKLVVTAGQAVTLDTKLQIGGRTEAVQVTGSLIPRPTLEAMSPVTTLEVEELTYRGISRVEDLLTSLPQVFVAQNSSVSNGATGTATVDLRYLGTVRTLVLIDGRRMPSGDTVDPAPDLNFIPSALVKRVDVLTGGASSTYGADAVAGVVNFVLDRDFTGFRGGIEYSGFQHNNSNALADSINAARGFPIKKGNIWNDGPVNWNVAFGSKFADGKGHASFYLDYRKTNSITKDQRDYTNCSTGSLTVPVSCGGSSTSPTGRFFVNDGSSFTIDPSNGLMVPWASKYAYNFAPANFMQRPDQRWAGGAFINYELNKHVQFYGDVMFMDDTTDAQIAPSGDFGNTFSINCDNPLLSASARAAFCTGQGYGPTDIAAVQIYRRNVEGGPRIDRLNHTDLRFTTGIKGEINSAWSYDMYGLQGSVRSPGSYANDLNTPRLQNALFVTGTAANPVCTTDTESGCVPWNIFTPGGVTQAALAYLAMDLVRDTGTRTRVFNGTVTGNLKDYGVVSPLATEGIKVAFGGEYRQEFLFVRPDYGYINFLGAGQGGPLLAVDGTYNVKEFFAEGLVPLVQDKPFVKDFSVEAGIRESNYSSTGTHATYKLQGSWAPSPDLKFRLGYNRATRSPNIVELFTPQGIGLGGSADPCAGPASGITYTPAQCALAGVPTSLYGKIPDNVAGQYNTLGGGNPDLSPEVANTWTAGAVLMPRKFLPGFTASFDYYNVQINQTIGSLGSNDILNTCATTGALCNLIHRDQFFTTWRSSDGYVLTTNQNVGELRSEGIDITGSYTRPMPHELGAVSVNLISTYLLKSFINTGLFSYDCVGYFGNTCGVPTPVWRHLTRFSWETPWNVTVAAGWRFLGPVTEDAGSPNEALANPARFAQEKQVGIDRIPSRNYLDVGVTWKVRKWVTFIAGVNNVFDKEPPFAPGSSPNDYGTGFYGTYDALGRYIHTGIQLTF